MIEIMSSDSEDERGHEPGSVAAASSSTSASGPDPDPDSAAADAAAAEPSSGGNRRSSNPFAAFAFQDAEEGDENAPLPAPAPLAFTAPTKRPAPPPPAKHNHSNQGQGQAKKRARPAPASTATGKRYECGPPEDFDALRAEERAAVYRKWQGIVGMASSPTLKLGSGDSSGSSAPASMDAETYRFRTLVAVILSSRTQEAMVRQAMQRLAVMPGGLTVDTLAAIDPADTSPLHERISFVHINKVKSKYIVMSARRIRDELGGRVPTDMDGLLAMHGIGPTLAPLLKFLYQYHEQKQQEKGKEEAQEQGKREGGAEGSSKAPVEVVILDDTPQKQHGTPQEAETA